jgi:nicotinate phosphoribosyltransferase
MVSGGLGEEEVLALRDVADGFGVGTTLSNAPTIDFALDIVEVEGVPFAKRGKMSGGKQVVFCRSCGARSVVPAPPGGDAASAALREGAPGGERPCPCGGTQAPLLLPALREGSPAAAARSPREIRERVLEQVRAFGDK